MNSLAGRKTTVGDLVTSAAVGCVIAALFTLIGPAADYLLGDLGAGAEAAPAVERGGIDFIVHPNGDTVIVPEGASGPFPAESGKGFQFIDGSGGHGLDPRTTDVRIMDPTPRYPNGYASYSNAGQTVDPYTGRTISPSDPWWHIFF
jgi:hypothetical protein